MKTVSLRPLVFVLSGFLTDAECDFIKGWAGKRMEPSKLATMDSTVSEAYLCPLAAYTPACHLRL